MDLKARLEFQSKTKVGKAELAEYYGQIKYAATSEKVSATFVEISMMLHNSVFKNAECTRLCMWFDELNEKNPLDSIYKIRSIVIGVDKKIPDFIWCMQMLWDWWQRTCKGEEITNRLLNGESSGWNGKSILDLFLYKRSLRNNLWRRMEKYSWADAIKTKIKEVTEDIQMCRACLGFVHNNKEFGDVDTTFRGSWPASASSFLLCLESLTFAYSEDDPMKTCMKNRRTIDDFLEHSDISHFLQIVDSQHAEETNPNGENDPDGDNSEDDEPEHKHVDKDDVPPEVPESSNLLSCGFKFTC